MKPYLDASRNIPLHMYQVIEMSDPIWTETWWRASFKPSIFLFMASWATSMASIRDAEAVSTLGSGCPVRDLIALNSGGCFELDQGSSQNLPAEVIKKHFSITLMAFVSWRMSWKSISNYYFGGKSTASNASADLFCGKRKTLDASIALDLFLSKDVSRQSCVFELSTCNLHFWRKSRRKGLFFRFQLAFWRKSRKVSRLSFQLRFQTFTSNLEASLQKSFVFKLPICIMEEALVSRLASQSVGQVQLIGQVASLPARQFVSSASQAGQWFSC